jgi:copper(I)-binding protein
MLRICLLAVLIAAPSGAASAAPSVTAAWSRPAVAGGVGGGYMTLSNPDRKPDTLVAVESASAARVEIHRSSMTAGVSSMRKIDRLELPAGAKVTFAPGGHHLMFIGLKAPLKMGDRLPATLVFASGARVKAEFKVTLTPPGATPGDKGAHAHH